MTMPGRLPNVAIATLLRRGRRRRGFVTDTQLSRDERSVLLWAAFGYREKSGSGRTVPSAGGIYSAEIHILAAPGGVWGIDSGVYHYQPQAHSIVLTGEGDARKGLVNVSLSQQFLGEAPIVLVVSADVEKTTAHYGKRGIRYVHMDIGHIGQNIYLIAEALGLGTVAVGAFDDDRLANMLGLPEGLFPFYLMPVGRVRS